jgi:aminoglycoside 6'-N-acetyltransferase
MAVYAFTPLTAADLALVGQWLGQPHVMQWWPDGKRQVRQIARSIGSTEVAPYMVSLAGAPLAYLQCEHLGAGRRGIDQFIGAADMIGRGHGSTFIRQFCDELFFGGEVTTVTTDPDPANARAIRAYEKAGFRPVERQSTPWGNVLLMQRDKTP